MERRLEDYLKSEKGREFVRQAIGERMFPTIKDWLHQGWELKVTWACGNHKATLSHPKHYSVSMYGKEVINAIHGLEDKLCKSMNSLQKNQSGPAVRPHAIKTARR